MYHTDGVVYSIGYQKSVLSDGVIGFSLELKCHGIFDGEGVMGQAVKALDQSDAVLLAQLKKNFDGLLR